MRGAGHGSGQADAAGHAGGGERRPGGGKRDQPTDGGQCQFAPRSAWECLGPVSRLRLGRVGSLTQAEVPGEVRRA